MNKMILTWIRLMPTSDGTVRKAVVEQHEVMGTNEHIALYEFRNANRGLMMQFDVLACRRMK